MIQAQTCRCWHDNIRSLYRRYSFKCTTSPQWKRHINI